MNSVTIANTQHRQDIDGLRAIAVLSVIFFHAGLSAFSGGFVGVDIFFVISGFLITSIILKEKSSQTFSIIKFYERRARRIVPALFFVIAMTTIVSCFFVMPTAFVAYGRSLIAVCLFVSNILFNQDKQTGYFNGAADEKPLLHTWSLAVEEQYYLVFPLLIILFWKLGKNRIFLLIIIATVMSLLLSEYAAKQGWLGNFFLIPTRAWELLIGSILAFIYLLYPHWLQYKSNIRSLLSMVGVGLIVFSVFVFDKNTPFPSFYALVPTLGAALIIAFPDPHPISSKILSNKLFVGVGLISYSAYLWHQPIFVLAKMISIYTPNTVEMLLLSMLSLVLAYFSWQFVEQPFRKKHLFSQKSIFLLTSIGSIILIAIGSLIIGNDGFEKRFNLQIQHWLNSNLTNKTSCIDQYTAQQIKQGQLCKAGDLNQAASFAVLGDSHAESLLQALNDQAIQQKSAFFMVSGGWCAPLLDFAGTNRYFSRCRADQAAALQSIAENEAIKTVVLVAEWSNYTTGYRWSSEPTAYFDQQSSIVDIDHNPQVLARALQRTLKLLAEHHKKIIIVKAVPEFEFKVTDTLIKNAITGQSLQYLKRTNLNDYMVRNAKIEQIFASLEAQPNGTLSQLVFVEPKKILCDIVTQQCNFRDTLGNPFYSDGSHLSFLGAKKIVPDIFNNIN